MRLLLPVLLLALLSPLLAEIKLPQHFSDHMVLQRGKPIPIWGTAAAGETVAITFLGATTETKAAQDGTWSLTLPSAKAGGPHELGILNGPRFTDVLVGDVWLGSGQSNMAGSAGGYAKRDQALQAIIDAGPYPTIRLLSNRKPWVESTPKNCASFSALLLSFGVALHEDVKVPIGLRVGAVGGTPSGRWLTKDMFTDNPPAMAMLEAQAGKINYEQQLISYKAALTKWETASAKAKEDGTRAPRKPKAPLEPGVLPAHVGDLYTSYIQSFEGYGISGILWDQGESGTAIPGLDQYTTMGALIAGWRKAFDQDVPFLYVQKPSGGGPAWDKTRPENIKADTFESQMDPRVPKWDAYRTLHVNIDRHPDTAIVQSVDLGSGVHPTIKSGYGRRAALVARGLAYEEDIAWNGPRYKSHTVKGREMHLSFDHVGSGLAFKHGDRLLGFAIAGPDGNFQWAEARIVGTDTIVLSHPDIASPTIAQYGWEKRRVHANAFNKEGLPMFAFRTDWTPPGK